MVFGRKLAEIVTFDFVEGTPPRQNANKICFCARLVRTFVTKYAETLYHSGLQRCRGNDCILYRAARNVGMPGVRQCRRNSKGLSPFNPESVAIEAGRLMLQRMDDLLSEGEDFAFETTLATRSYVKFVERAQAKGYFVTLLYFWLPTPEQAIERVATRVSEGGHNIPSDVIRRRYANGIKNLTILYTPICNFWTIYDNSSADEEIKNSCVG